jgi:hypothetical protein
MCMLCGETREQGRREALNLAESLRRMAAIQEGLAYGRLKPHTDDTNGSSELAASLIRNLVAEYI